MNDLFKSRYGPEQRSLIDALLKVHDHVGNVEKRPWLLLAKVAEDVAASNNDTSVEMLAAALVDAARKRLNDAIIKVQGRTDILTHDQARKAVLETDVGQTLQDLLETAESAALATSLMSKRVDASLAAKADEQRLFDCAKDIQVSKARAGRPVTLIDALEIAKASV